MGQHPHLKRMLSLIQELKFRNEHLFYFGLFCFLLSLVFIVLTKTTSTEVQGLNAWVKPFKFAVSIGLFSWTMAWYCHYLSDFNVAFFNWSVIILFGFELFYISFQASKGQLSHFNFDTPLYSILYSFMGIAAVAVTLYTAYIGFLFFTHSFPSLPSHYVWGIRLGILIFVIFSFEGALMSLRVSHSVGAINDNSNWWIIGWSKTVGDLRVSHFIGMHALQILPLLSFYIFKNTKATIIFSILYLLLAVSTLVQALNGHPIIAQNKINESE